MYLMRNPFPMLQTFRSLHGEACDDELVEITNTTVEVLEKSREAETDLENVDQGELEMKNTHNRPGAPRWDLYITWMLIRHFSKNRACKKRFWVEVIERQYNTR